MNINEEIIFEKKDNIAWIILNRPEKLNALSMKMLEEISSVLDKIEKDLEIRCIIITGFGEKSFCSGADISIFQSLNPIMAEEFARKGQKIFCKIGESSKPFIAAINGYCLGGGLELALACDFRIASENAEFGSPEINLGLIPGWCGTQRLTRIIGINNAKKIIMLGERIKAEEALRIGLIDKIVPIEKLHEEAILLCKKLIEKPSNSLKYAKRLINLSYQVPINIGELIEAEAFGILKSTEDINERISAFLSKKKK
ncbi:MAG: enoyl-CoA hydratase-related protein [Nitrososphaerota archaeon]